MAAVAWAAMTSVILVVMAPLAGIVWAVSLPLVRSCGGDSVTNMLEPGVEEPSHSR
jgi:hypothetical protein